MPGQPCSRHAPTARHRRRAVRRTQQSSRDRRHRVGVVSRPDRGVQRQPKVVGPEHASVRIVHGHRRCGDRRPRRLQRRDHPPVVRERCRGSRFRVVQTLRPQVAAAGLEMVQADSHIELAGEHRVPDRAAPQHTRVAGVRVEVRELADRARRLHHRVLVVEIGERHRRRAHQRSVARRASCAPVELLRLRPGAGRSDDAIPRRGPQHRTASGYRCLWRRATTRPALHDRVLCGLVEQIGARRRDLRDGDRHRRVIGPLAGLPPAATDHRDLEFRPTWRLELVWRTQRIPCCGRQQHTLNTIVVRRHPRLLPVASFAQVCAN